MLKLKPVKRVVIQEEPKQPPKEVKQQKHRKLPPDEYRDEFDPKIIPVNEYSEIHVSVKRGGELGLPRVDIRFFSITERFKGATKKGIALPLDKLPELIAQLQGVHNLCDLKGLYDGLDEEPDEFDDNDE